MLNREPMGGKHLDHAAKHAYDISQLLYRYPNGVDALVERLVPPYLTVVGPEQSTIDRALQVLREHFADREAAGIRLMVREGDYLDEKADEERKMRDQQGIVGRVRRFLDRLDARVASVY